MGDNRYMPDSNGLLRVGVVGTGAFGRNHARVYRDLQADTQLNVQFVGVADADATAPRSVAIGIRHAGVWFRHRTYWRRASMQCPSQFRPSRIWPWHAS